MHDNAPSHAVKSISESLAAMGIKGEKLMVWQEFAFLADLPQIGESAPLSADLTLKELHAAVMSLANSRAPGIDGIPSDFY